MQTTYFTFLPLSLTAISLCYLLVYTFVPEGLDRKAIFSAYSPGFSGPCHSTSYPKSLTQSLHPLIPQSGDEGDSVQLIEGGLSNIREWDVVVQDGYRLRNLAPPAEDISIGGSTLITIESNYEVETQVSSDIQDSFHVIHQTLFGKEARGKRSVTEILNPNLLEGNPPIKYTFSIVPEKGLFTIHSPSKESEQAAQREDRHSEIYWKAWYDGVQRFNKENLQDTSLGVSNLEYIAIDQISDSETRAIVTHASKTLRHTPYFHHTQNLATREGKPPILRYEIRIDVANPNPVIQNIFSAVLGSRALKRIGYLTKQHASALGRKEVVEVIIIEPVGSGGSYPTIAFKLGQLPKNHLALKSTPPAPQLPDKQTIFQGREKNRRNRRLASIRNAEYKLAGNTRQPINANSATHGGELENNKAIAQGVNQTFLLERRTPGDGETLQATHPPGYRPRRIRDFDVVATSGFHIRSASRPVSDVSERGSEIISEDKHNYGVKLRTEKFEGDPLTQGYYIGPRIIDGQLQVLPEKYRSFEIGNPRPDNNLVYNLIMHPQLRALVVDFAFKLDDVGEPVERRFSEIMYRAWYEQVDFFKKLSEPWYTDAPSINIELEHLDYIVRNYIANPETRKVVEEIFVSFEDKAEKWGYGSKDGKVYWAGKRITFNAFDPDPVVQRYFNLLIGCRNGVGGARMLNDHPNAFQNKVIVEIEVIEPEPEVSLPCITYKLGYPPDNAPVPTNPTGEEVKLLLKDRQGGLITDTIPTRLVKRIRKLYPFRL
ncbi:hypothetical protein ABW19_dt0204442 [Dactylella cylindrospora]|nr:hypothetical protein ABW19_dt0204442 [Dactylella cylindrospora]